MFFCGQTIVKNALRGRGKAMNHKHKRGLSLWLCIFFLLICVPIHADSGNEQEESAPFAAEHKTEAEPEKGLNAQPVDRHGGDIFGGGSNEETEKSDRHADDSRENRRSRGERSESERE